MTSRPALVPGAVVLRRDETHLQVGTEPGVVLRDRPGLHRLLLALDGHRSTRALTSLVPEIGDVTSVLRELTALGILAAPSTRTAPPHLTVSVHDGPGGERLATTVRQVLGDVGLTVDGSLDTDVLVVVAAGEPGREPFSEAVRRGLSHLPVRIDHDRVRVGPFVVPGSSPCLGCHDLHRTDWDPGWAALIPQFGGRSLRLNPPSPDALLRHAAALEVAAGLHAVAAREPSPQLGRVVVVGPGPMQRSSWPVAFHHRCACALLSAA